MTTYVSVDHPFSPRYVLDSDLDMRVQPVKTFCITPSLRIQRVDSVQRQRTMLY